MSSVRPLKRPPFAVRLIALGSASSAATISAFLLLHASCIGITIFLENTGIASNQTYVHTVWCNDRQHKERCKQISVVPSRSAASSVASRRTA